MSLSMALALLDGKERALSKMTIVYILYVIILAAQFLLIALNQLAQATVVFACFLTFLIYRPIIFRNSILFISFPGVVPVLLLTGFMVLQILPLPFEWLSVISPASSGIYAETVWNVDPNVWMPVSIDTRSTVQRIFLLSAFFAFYLLATQISVYKSQGCLIWITFISVITFFVGISAQISGALFTANDVLLARPVMEYVFHLKDSAIAVVVVIAPLVYAAFKISDQKVTGPRFRKTRLFYRRAVLVLVLGVIIISGSLLIWSVVFVSLVSWGATFVIKRQARGQAVQLASLLFVVALAGIFMCSSGLSSHMFWSWDKSPQVNPHAIRTGHHINHKSNFSLAGTGIDTFDAVMFFSAPENDLSNSQTSRVWQLISETGLIGTALILWFVIDLLRKTSARWRKHRNKTAIYTFAGAFASLQAYLLIATAAPYTSYSIPIFYLALVFSFMASFSKSSATEASVAQDTGCSKRGWGGMILLLTFCMYFGGEFYAEMESPLAASEKGDLNLKSANGEGENNDDDWAELAVKAAPLNYWQRQSLIDRYYAKGDYNKALRHATLLLRLSPLSEETLLSTGMIYNALNDNEKAELLMQASLKTRPASNNHNIKRINRLLSLGKREEAVRYTYYSLNNHPEKTGDSLALLDLYGVPESEIESAIPEKSYAYWVYAKRLLSQNNNIMANMYLIDAIRMSSGEARPDPQIYLTAIESLERDNRQNEALSIALQGQESFPYNAQFTFQAAQLYEQAGIKYRAIEEYRKTLFLDPGNRLAEKKITILQNR